MAREPSLPYEHRTMSTAPDEESGMAAGNGGTRIGTRRETARTLLVCALAALVPAAALAGSAVAGPGPDGGLHDMAPGPPGDTVNPGNPKDPVSRVEPPRANLEDEHGVRA
ncbi:hypothetical protein HG826_30370 [Streptomyces sp. GMY01]|nr:hypothetical protein [Streptomyces sennicomposti]MYS39709.1 hypothetical protein [Streptomyces sp. SID5998]NMO37816.1 hypothetical protein [Streptomyces sp. GMY02]